MLRCKGASSGVLEIPCFRRGVFGYLYEIDYGLGLACNECVRSIGPLQTIYLHIGCKRYCVPLTVHTLPMYRWSVQFGKIAEGFKSVL
jgi:hypothetical protein